MERIKIKNRLALVSLLLMAVWLVLRSVLSSDFFIADLILVLGAVLFAWSTDKFRRPRPLALFLLALMLLFVIITISMSFMVSLSLLVGIAGLMIAARSIVRIRGDEESIFKALVIPFIIIISGFIPLFSSPLSFNIFWNIILFILIGIFFSFAYIESTPKRGRLLLSLIFLIVILNMLQATINEIYLQISNESYLARIYFFVMKIVLFTAFITILRIVANPPLAFIQKRFRLRTKIGLSYIFSGLLPVLIILIVSTLAVFLTIGAFSSNLVSRMIENKNEILKQNLVKETSGRIDNFELISKRLTEITNGDVYVGQYILTDIQPDTVISDDSERNRNIVITRSFTKIDTIHSESGNEIIFTTALYPLNKTQYMLDSVFFEEKPEVPVVINAWDGTRFGALAIVESNGKIICAFRPIGVNDLVELKEDVGLNVKFWNVGNFRTNQTGFDYSTSLTNPPYKEDFTDTSKTAKLKSENVFDKLIPLSVVYLPVEAITIRTSYITGATLILQTSIHQLLSTVFSQANEVNRISLYVLLAFSVILLQIVILAASLGFAINGLITSSASKLKKATKAVSAGDFDHYIVIDTKDEFGELAVSFNEMSAKIKKMMEEVKEKEALKKELQIAHNIQANLLPENPPQIRGWDIAAYSEPAKEVGGDFYDFIKLLNGKIAFSIGDVSGKGMPAALLMSNLQASLRIIATASNELGAIISSLNRQAYCATSEEMFATMFYGILDPLTGILQYVNAGHDFPLVLKNGEISTLETGGLLLGAFEEITYEVGEVMIEPGDSMIMYSDGITEAMNSKDEPYGLENLKFVLDKSDKMTANSLLTTIIENVEKYAGDCAQSDDMTIICMKRI